MIFLVPSFPIEFLLISSGICIAVSIIFLLVGFGIESRNRTHIYFSAMSFLFFLFFLNSVVSYNSISIRNLDLFTLTTKLGLFIFYLALVSQYMFIKEYTDKKTDPLFKAIIIFSFLLAFSNLFLPFSWLYSKISFSSSNITIIPSFWIYIESLVTILIYFTYMTYNIKTYYKLENKIQSIILSTVVLTFLLSYILDFILIQFLNSPFFLISQFGFLVFIVTISLFQSYNIKQSEREFEKMALMVSEITKQTGEGITVADRDGHYIFTNKAWTEMTGYTEEEVLTMTVKDFLIPNDEPRLFRTVRKNQPGIRELELVKKDGSRFLAEISGFPLVLDHKIVVLGVVRDVTKRRLLEKNQEESARMELIGKLAGGIAHDFNNILAGIMGYAQMTSMTLPAESEAHNYINQIMTAGNRGKNLINQILLFSRKDKELDKPNFVGPIVNEAMILLKASLPSTISIQTNIQIESSPVLINSTRLHEVIINLVTNASEAIMDKGEIEVSVTESIIEESIIGRKRIIFPGIYTIITVKDNGSGIDDETIKQNLFQPFFTTKVKGTGMGLAVVYGIIKNSNGEIIVQSEVGKGTIFNIYLPQTDRKYEPEINNKNNIIGGNEHILFVDDEDIVLDSLTKILQKIGFTVYAYSDPVEALKFFERENSMLNLVITDQTMPQLTGFELSEKMLKIRPDMKIILISGYSKELSEQKAIETGLRAILRKPFEINKLTIKIREVLDNDLPFY